MIKQINFLALLAICFGIIITACNKQNGCNSSDEFGDENEVMILESGYTSTVVSSLEKEADYPYYTKGVITYKLNDKELATIDFGNGEHDAIATMKINGQNNTVDLTAKGKNSIYTKVITNPLIKTAGCDYIVEGTIEYYKDAQLVATIDFGNGTCDQWATKTWPAGSSNGKTWVAGSKTFDLNDLKKKKKK